MRHLPPVALVLLLSASRLGAQSDYVCNHYDLERWEEDYSYLKSPDARGKDPFDPIKFVPLNTSGSAYLSFGGQVRERYDYFNNLNFGAGPQDEDGFRLTRMLAHVDAHFGPSF